MSNYNVTASRFSLSAFACGDSMPLKGVSVMSVRQVTMMCIEKGVGFNLANANVTGSTLRELKFCPVCGVPTDWGWFGFHHTVSDTYTARRISPTVWFDSDDMEKEESYPTAVTESN